MLFLALSISRVALFTYYCFNMELIIGNGILELVCLRCNWYRYNVIDPKSGYRANTDIFTGILKTNNLI